MCWSPEVSISTFMFSMFCILLAYYYDVIDFFNLLLLSSFISMQLVEFFLWIYLDNPIMNRVFSMIGFVLVFLVPFFSIVSIPETYKYKYLILLVYIIYVVGLVLSTNIIFKTVVATNKHLEWKWLDVSLPIVLLYALFLSSRYFYYLDNDYSKMGLVTLWGLLAISYFSYVKYNTWASMWCWMANIMAYVYLYRVIQKLYL